MTPEQLKASILQHAIQGKLTEHRLEDGTGEELYQQIQDEKHNLIKEGKIKKEKALPDITAEEIPFEIPEGWMWTRLGEISWYFDAGKSPNCEKRPANNDEWGVITTTAIQLDFFDEVQNKVLPKSFEVNTAIQVRNNDILITRAGPMNRTGIACLVKNIKYNLILSDKTIRLNMTDDNIDKSYIVMVLNSPQIRQLIIDRMSGMDKQQVNVSQVKYKTVLIPLPPLAEQKRIVSKVEELLPIVDRYAVAYEKLERFNAKFPKDMKKSILQYAIQGKLVEQIAEEGTGEVLYDKIQNEKQDLIKNGKIKKEKPLPEISDDEIPFDIPETWKWVRLDDIVRKSIKRGKSPTYTHESGTLVFAQKCNTKAGCINLDIALFLDESKLGKYPEEEFMRDGDIVINSTGNGTLGRVGIYRKTDNSRQLPIVPDSHVTVIRANTSVSVDYVYYVLKYYQPYMEKLGTGSTNQTELSANTVRALLFPLPPLAEQERIALKLGELLPFCDRLVK